MCLISMCELTESNNHASSKVRITCVLTWPSNNTVRDAITERDNTARHNESWCRFSNWGSLRFDRFLPLATNTTVRYPHYSPSQTTSFFQYLSIPCPMYPSYPQLMQIRSNCLVSIEWTGTTSSPHFLATTYFPFSHSLLVYVAPLEPWNSVSLLLASWHNARRLLPAIHQRALC